MVHRCPTRVFRPRATAQLVVWLNLRPEPVIFTLPGATLTQARISPALFPDSPRMCAGG